MESTVSQPAIFQPRAADADGCVTWIHIGDLHMTAATEQNAVDLGRIVDAINEHYSKAGVSFVYFPGDIADHGSADEYHVVRSHLDRLQLPWCGIVGDHDVHEKHFDNFRQFISNDLTSAFTVGKDRFLRLNAFSEPRPDSFVVDDAQLQWIEDELRAAQQKGQRAVLLLHCYPSDLKQGGAKLTEMVKKYPVVLVDMGHTHYNEVSNDGRALYSATRSTGQIEEGPVGFSVVSVDGDTVSWHFVPVESPELIAITAPSDRRLVFQAAQQVSAQTDVHAKVWSGEAVQRVTATIDGSTTDLLHDGGVSWKGNLTIDPADVKQLEVTATLTSGCVLRSAIEVGGDDVSSRAFAEVDQDNAIGAWEERGILGTQLGPNKNGRKW